MKKILMIVIMALTLIFMIFHVVFYRKDISMDTLKTKYQNEHSNYLEMSILSLESLELPIKIHYLDYGVEDHPVIVLLHGMFSSAFTFEKWANLLIEEGYRVIAIDLPYHGLSTGFHDQKTSLRRSSLVVYEVLKHLDINEIVIGGNSYGGGVSWYFASEFNHQDIEVKGLILIDSIYQQDHQEGQRFESLSESFLKDWISKMTPRFLIRRLLSGAYGSKSILDTETVIRYEHFIRKEGYRSSLISMKFEDLSSDIAPLLRMNKISEDHIETLILWGAEDAWISVDVAYLLKNDLNLDDGRIIIYPFIGHVPMEENPNLTMIDILQFLSEIGY